MKKSLFLALALVTACGYAVAQEEATQAPQAQQEETVQPTQPVVPAEEAKPAQPEEDSFDMGDDLGLDEETEEVK